jgi:ABC-2 type transport system ATP-binding protein
MSGVPALRVEGLGKRYGRRHWALRDCSFELPEGGIAGLVGANGAGKTTLLHLVIGLLEPTEGRIRILGGKATIADIGFVAQDHPLYRWFTVADMLHFGRSMNGRFDLAGARRRLEQLEIPLGRRAGRLSGGQQAQVALTLAVAKRPRLLVLDEPVASLDPLARKQFMKTLIEEVAGTGLSVLLSSHVVGELERVCDHLVVLDRGRVRLAGEIDEILAGHRVLSGPRAAAEESVAGLVSATHGDRQSHLLVRQPAGVPAHPRWESHPARLEELVLAYLEKTERQDS